MNKKSNDFFQLHRRTPLATLLLFRIERRARLLPEGLAEFPFLLLLLGLLLLVLLGVVLLPLEILM